MENIEKISKTTNAEYFCNNENNNNPINKELNTDLSQINNSQKSTSSNNLFINNNNEFNKELNLNIKKKNSLGIISNISDKFSNHKNKDDYETDLNKSLSTTSKVILNFHNNNLNDNLTEIKSNNYNFPNNKYLVLILVCLSGLGSFYCFDLPGALKSSIKQYYEKQYKDEDLESKITLMYSMYSIPNIVIPLVCGYLIEKFGSRNMFLYFVILITMGQLFFVAGFLNSSINISLLGRFIFGIGGESLNTAQAIIITDWFSVKEISLIYGILLSWGRLTSFSNDYFSPKIATNHSLILSVVIGFIICILSLISASILLIIEKRKYNYLKKQNQETKQALPLTYNENKNISEINSRSHKEEISIYNTSDLHIENEDIEINELNGKDHSFFDTLFKLNKVSFVD